MNPIKERIKEKLERVPRDFSSLSEHGFKYLKYSSIIDIDGSLKIGHTPWVAPYSFAITLYMPAKKVWFDKYKDRMSKSIPTMYQKFLLISNGCYYYDFNLFGLPPSLQQDPPLIDRKNLQVLDLDAANKYWINNFKLDNEKFYFGGRAYNSEENIGYFINDNKIIQVIRENGEIIKQWTNFSEFLSEELNSAETTMKKETPDDWWS